VIPLKKLTIHPHENLFSRVENSIERLEIIPQWSELDYSELTQVLDWQEESIRMFGKEIRVPRLVVWYGEKGYGYSGKRHQPKAIPEMIQREMNRLSAETGVEFNGVLCNWYRNGEEHMGFHSDDEPEIYGSLIASISLGASRRFAWKKKDGSEGGKVGLESGSLLLMHHFQENWKHALLKDPKVGEGRINLTFRKIR
jgi:alkylated DNA repair dioxygenase AlkB